MNSEFLIVGAGFAGAVVAEQLAAAGRAVHLIDKRLHIGGNAFDCFDAHGILVHKYGPHIFHTNSVRVAGYLSRFTAWRPYEHRVRAVVGGVQYPMPINRTTINRLYGLALDEEGVRKFLESVQEPRTEIRSSEDVVLSNIGRDLCDKFFRGYTRKQWGCDLSELSAGVAARIPTRTSDDDRYFTDAFQAMPIDGYTKMFERMLDHKNISVQLGTCWQEVCDRIDYGHLVFTGPIDEYFGHTFGSLPYRSLRFEHLHFLDIDKYQETGTINYPNDFEFTRITEFKHLTGQIHRGTSIVREYPLADGEPFYPIPRAGNEALFRRYKELADHEHRVTFVGRLAEYRYYNMDQVVAAALKVSAELATKSV